MATMWRLLLFLKKTNMHVLELSIAELLAQYRSGKTTPTEVLKTYQAQVAKTEDDIKAFITLDWEQAFARAKALEQAGSKDLSLYGVPIGVKDVYMTKGMRTTAGSKILENYTATYTATAIEKLDQAGAIIIGKQNCDEFAQGTTTEFSGFYPTKNPYDLTKVPGGSSGGSAASVAARQVLASIGSDTGGSIRLPAAYCGSVAIKTTYGLISRYGLIAMASSFDTVGPITRTAEDAAHMLQAMVGHDPLDSTTHEREVEDYVSALSQDLSQIKIAIPKQANITSLPENIQAQVEATKNYVESLGGTVAEVDMPYLEKALAAYYVIVPAEVSSNMAKFDGIRFGEKADNTKNLLEHYMQTRDEFLGDEVKRRIMIGTYVLSSGYIDAYYKQAQKVRRLVADDFKRVFKEYDALLMPIAPNSPFELGAKLDDPLALYLIDMYTVTANVAGVPAVALPTGLVDSVPYGVQFLGSYFSEGKLLALAHQIEQQRGAFPTPGVVSYRD